MPRHCTHMPDVITCPRCDGRGFVQLSEVHKDVLLVAKECPVCLGCGTISIKGKPAPRKKRRKDKKEAAA
ncbi:MAG TPA: hypothetical protein VEY08_16155 [Chloroflexia bacterium]|nr:hypothetical protein [Chloroflexia bacterium]